MVISTINFIFHFFFPFRQLLLHDVSSAVPAKNQPRSGDGLFQRQMISSTGPVSSSSASPAPAVALIQLLPRVLVVWWWRKIMNPDLVQLPFLARIRFSLNTAWLARFLTAGSSIGCWTDGWRNHPFVFADLRRRQPNWKKGKLVL